MKNLLGSIRSGSSRCSFCLHPGLLRESPPASIAAIRLGDQALDPNDTQGKAGEAQPFVELFRLAILDDIKAKAQAIVEWAEDFAKELNSVTTAPKSAAKPEGGHDAAE